MKKFFNSTLLIVVLVAIVVSFGACSNTNNSIAPTLDLQKAEDNLRARNYNIETRRDYLFSFGLENYAIEKYLSAAQEEGDKYILILQFKSAKSAKYFYDYKLSYYIDYHQKELKWYQHLLEEYGDEMYVDEKNELQDLIKDMKEEYSSYIIGYSSKYVWIANYDEAIQDTK